METTHTDARLHFTPQLLVGLLVIVVGVLFTLDNLGMVEAGEYLKYWPVALIALGATKVWNARGRGSAFAGGLLVIIGAWLVMESARIVTIELWDLWPMVLVFFGASLVWRGALQRPKPETADGNATISTLAVLGGVNRRSNSPNFKGGDVTAVLGGCVIDLRQAGIEGEAALDLFAMWGGIEIHVPENWTVVSRVIPFLGGYEDKTRSAPAAGPRLVLRGFAIMGGIEVKH